MKRKIDFLELVHLILISPCRPILYIDEAYDDSPVHGDGRDREGRDDNENGLERGLEMAEERRGAPVPPLVHNLHLGKQKEVTYINFSIMPINDHPLPCQKKLAIDRSVTRL